jgi:ATP-binding cassette subfamily B protein
VFDVINPLISAHIIDNNVVKGTWAGIGPWIALYVTILVFQVINVYGFIANAGIVETSTVCNLRRAGFTHLQELSFSFYDRTAVGYIMARMTSDAQRLADTIAWSLVDIFWGFGYMLMASVAMLIYNWQLALMVLATVPVIALLSMLFQRILLRAHREVRRANSRITGAFNEGIGGAKTTKTLVREELNQKEFVVLTGNMRRNSIRAAVMSSIFMPIIMTIGAIGTSLILWQGGVQVLWGDITLGEFNFFIMLGSWFFEPINNIARQFAELQSSQAAVERVIKLLDTQPEIVDKPEVIAQYGDAFHPKKENWPAIKGRIDFENVSFAYQGGQKVLENFNLHVKAGERIALVGETGSGKSTIVNLVCRFYEPTSGRILIDGTDYRERSQLWLHSNLGYVLQAPHLFSGSIADNIRYGRIEASDEDVERAARMVDAHNFIMKLEKGYDTQVGEGGGRLSTGEKQLVSFARAILADPALFVLDEATSSIDTETEQIIQNAVERVLHNRTSFIIAHRLSTIRSADRILVVREGKVTEEGTHRQLMQKRGYYYNLYTTQFMEEAENRLLGGGTKEIEETV